MYACMLVYAVIEQNILCGQITSDRSSAKGESFLVLPRGEITVGGRNDRLSLFLTPVMLSLILLQICV